MVDVECAATFSVALQEAIVNLGKRYRYLSRFVLPFKSAPQTWHQ